MRNHTTKHPIPIRSGTKFLSKDATREYAEMTKIPSLRFDVPSPHPLSSQCDNLPLPEGSERVVAFIGYLVLLAELRQQTSPLPSSRQCPGGCRISNFPDRGKGSSNQGKRSACEHPLLTSPEYGGGKKH